MIKDFKENEKFVGPLLVNNVTKGISNKSVPYMNITLQDSSGIIEGKKWVLEPGDETIAIPGQIIEVTGEVIEYKNNFQLKILAIDPYTGVSNIEDFVQSAPVPKTELYDKICSYIDLIGDDDLKTIVVRLVNTYLEKFMIYPAATRNHHEYCCGLMHHIAGMLELAKSICASHPEVNSDILYSGIILHDLGKVFEFSGPFLPKYTLQGKLIGHISIVSALISETAKELNIVSENILLLQHMVLSHHGKLEYGSPVVPLTLEAELLFFIDNIDSKINMFNKALKEVGEGEFTMHQFPLEGRCLYKPNKK